MKRSLIISLGLTALSVFIGTPSYSDEITCAKHLELCIGEFNSCKKDHFDVMACGACKFECRDAVKVCDLFNDYTSVEKATENMRQCIEWGHLSYY
jgi:hypothetical protein